jgi:hypothetical protein
MAGVIATPLPDRSLSPPGGGDRNPCVRLRAGVLRRSSAQSCPRPLESLFWPFTARLAPSIHARPATDREAKTRGRRPGGRTPRPPRTRRIEPRRSASLPPGIDPKFSSANLPLKMHDDIMTQECPSCLFSDPSRRRSESNDRQGTKWKGSSQPSPVFFRRFFTGVGTGSWQGEGGDGARRAGRRRPRRGTRAGAATSAGDCFRGRSLSNSSGSPPRRADASLRHRRSVGALASL